MANNPVNFKGTETANSIESVFGQANVAPPGNDFGVPEYKKFSVLGLLHTNSTSSGYTTCVPNSDVPSAYRPYITYLSINMPSGNSLSGGTGLEIVDSTGAIFATFTDASLGLSSSLVIPYNNNVAVSGVVDNAISFGTSASTSTGHGIMIVNNGSVTITGGVMINELRGYYAP